MAVRPTKQVKEAKAPPVAQKRRGGASAARAAAQAECDAMIAAATETSAPAENHRIRSTGRRAVKALTLADAGFDLAEDIAAGDGHLQVNLEALGLWLAGLVDTPDGKQVARWRLIPEETFTASKRKTYKRWRDPKRKKQVRSVVRNARGLRLKTEAREWLWKEFALTLAQDGETDTAKAFFHLMAGHKEAAERLVERFLAARHSTQDEVKTRLYKTATALAIGDAEGIRETRKEDRDRLAREYGKPALEECYLEFQSWIRTAIDPKWQETKRRSIRHLWERHHQQFLDSRGGE